MMTRTSKTVTSRGYIPLDVENFYILYTPVIPLRIIQLPKSGIFIQNSQHLHRGAHVAKLLAFVGQGGHILKTIPLN